MPSSPEAILSRNVILPKSSKSISSFILKPAFVTVIFSSPLTVILISALAESAKSSTLTSVLFSKIRLVISWTVLSSRSKYTLPSAVLMANSPESNCATLG